MGKFFKRGWMASLFISSLVSGAFADPAWYPSLGLTQDQGRQLRDSTRAKTAAIKQAYQDKEGNAEYLAQQVLSVGGDAVLQPILGQVLSNLQTMEKADDDYWRNLQSFLAPSQVAKIYLKLHPDVAPATAPARPKDGVNWAAYVGLTPAQLQQLKSANIQWMGQMKEKISQKTSACQQMEKAVQAGAPDAEIQPILNALLDAVREKGQAERDYYGKDLPAFLNPTQVAKLYLHRRPPKEGFTPPSGGSVKTRN